MSERECTCSIYANEPNAWCEKHGEALSEEEVERFRKNESLFYKMVLGAFAATAKP